MSRKIIDYIVVEERNDSHKYVQHYSGSNKGEALKISLFIKNIEDEILIQEYNIKLSQEVIKYIDILLNTVEDFSNYNVSGSDVLFYQKKFNASHPIKHTKSYDHFDETKDEYYRKELKEEILNKKKEIADTERKIASAKNEIQRLKIKESAIIENNQKLDFETFRTDFEKSVMYYLEKGYELQGGIATRYDIHYFRYYQAMVKYEDQ